MATLTGQTIASSYEQLLSLPDGGGNGTTHVAVTDGDGGTTFPITLATDAIMITSTNRLEFGDDGTYIHQSADGVLDLVSDTEIEINATTIDINGEVNVGGNYILKEQGRQNQIPNTMPAPYYRFDGTNDYISLGTDAKLDITVAISLSSWVRGHSSGGDTSFFIICRDDDATHQQYFISFDSSNLNFRIFDGGSAQTVSYSVDLRDDKWHHVAGTYDGSNLKLYLDGVEVATQAYSGDIDSEGANEPVFIGQRGDNARRMYGDIAQAQIFNLALSATEIKNLYSGESLPYKYKGASATDLLQNSGNHANVNFTSFTSNAGDGSISAWNVGTGGQYCSTPIPELVIGKQYRIRFTLASGMNDGMYFVVSPNTNLEGSRMVLKASSWSSGDQVFTFTPSMSGIDNVGFIKGYGTNDGALPALSNWSFTQIGAVAEFDGSGIASDKWLDKSGNDLHGTVTTADVTNAPSGDDGLVYEEGTFTPAIKFGSSTTGIAYHANTLGKYYRIGNTVFITANVKLTSKGSASGNLRVTGLPYPVNSGGELSGFTTPYWTFTSDDHIGLQGAGSEIAFYEKTNSGGVGYINDGNFADTTEFGLSGTYNI